MKLGYKLDQSSFRKCFMCVKWKLDRNLLGQPFLFGEVIFREMTKNTDSTGRYVTQLIGSRVGGIIWCYPHAEEIFELRIEGSYCLQNTREGDVCSASFSQASLNQAVHGNRCCPVLSQTRALSVCDRVMEWNSKDIESIIQLMILRKLRRF